jgi:hypothetical protein
MPAASGISVPDYVAVFVGVDDLKL